MPSIVTDLMAASVVFAATNLDDIFLLLAFFADRRYRPAHVIIGQVTGIATLFAVSALASLISLALQPRWLGLLGLIPVALGLKAIRDLRGPAEGDDERPPESGGNTITAVAWITIANGGDNLGVYTPLFATLPAARIAVYGAVFAVLTLLWCDLARRLVMHPSWGAPIRRLSSRLLPVVLIAVGLWILIDMDTLSLLRPA